MGLPPNYPLSRFAELIDAEFHNITGLQILGWLHAHRNARGRSGTDDVAGQQRHKLADIAYQRGNIENHLARRASLPIFAIHLQPHAEPMGIRDLIMGCEKRTQGSEGIRTFSFYPLSTALELERTFRIIVVQRVSSN